LSYRCGDGCGFGRRCTLNWVGRVAGICLRRDVGMAARRLGCRWPGLRTFGQVDWHGWVIGTCVSRTCVGGTCVGGSYVGHIVAGSAHFRPLVQFIPHP
jgi:hypothetical protein